MKIFKSHISLPYLYMKILSSRKSRMKSTNCCWIREGLSPVPSVRSDPKTLSENTDCVSIIIESVSLKARFADQTGLLWNRECVVVYAEDGWRLKRGLCGPIKMRTGERRDAFCRATSIGIDWKIALGSMHTLVVFYPRDYARNHERIHTVLCLYRSKTP